MDLKVPSTCFYGEKQCMHGWRCGMSGCGAACKAQTGRVSGRGLQAGKAGESGRAKACVLWTLLFVTQENKPSLRGLSASEVVTGCGLREPQRGRAWSRPNTRLDSLEGSLGSFRRCHGGA